VIHQPLLRRKQAAEVRGIHVKTLDANARDGLVPFVRLPSGQRRYRRADIERLIDTEREAS